MAWRRYALAENESTVQMRVGRQRGSGPIEEYLLYQTLVGTWPLESSPNVGGQKYTARIQQFMQKALREAKIHTSWMSPWEQYESATKEFIANILSSQNEAFADDVTNFVAGIADAGFVN